MSSLFQRAVDYARRVPRPPPGTVEVDAAGRHWMAGYLAALKDVRAIYFRKGGGVATDMHALLDPKNLP